MAVDTSKYKETKDRPCICCGTMVTVTKFASDKTVQCPKCKESGAKPNQQIVASITAPKSTSKPTGDTKVCQCIKCGKDVTVTKFASPSKVECDECKGVAQSDDDEYVERNIKIDLSKLDRSAIPELGDYFILPSAIKNPNLREVKCPACGKAYMKIIKILDGSGYGLVAEYQCHSCFTMVTISEQSRHIVNPIKPGVLINYRGDDIRSSITSIQDTRVSNMMQQMYDLLVANNIPIEGIQIPEHIYRCEEKFIPVGFNTNIKPDEEVGHEGSGE